MKKIFLQYLLSAWYNIRRNKSYALFCIAGTALTFVFVTFLVHFGAVMQGDYPPSVHSGRIITLNHFTDTKGNRASRLSTAELKMLPEQLKDCESYATHHLGDEMTGVEIDENYFSTAINFVSAGYWTLYAFDFVAGRPFTEDASENRKRCAVITKNLSKSKFHTINSVGKKIIMDRNEYEIIGVVDNFSLMASSSGATEIWFPDVFDNAWSPPALSILFSPQTDMRQAGEKIAERVRAIYEMKHIEVRINACDLLTDKEKNQKNNELLSGGSLGMLLFLFLLIPSLNIISLNMANARSRAEEIAIRRTFGASRRSSFAMVVFDHLLLTLAGVVIGMLLTKPFVLFIQQAFFDEIPMLAGSSLMPDVDIFLVTTVILPLMIVFLFLFSGLPAWLTAKRRISEVLKGGLK
jgi:ABC-type antimicrobial peptide transport system permease subunit